MPIRQIPQATAELGPLRLYEPSGEAHPECYIVKHSRQSGRSVRNWPLKVYNMVEGLEKGMRDDDNNPHSTYAFLFKGGTVRVNTYYGEVEIQKTHPRLEEVLWDFVSLDSTNSGYTISLD